MWVAVSFSFFVRTLHNNAENNADKEPREHDILGKIRKTKDQPADQGIYPDMFDP